MKLIKRPLNAGMYFTMGYIPRIFGYKVQYDMVVFVVSQEQIETLLSNTHLQTVRSAHTFVGGALY